MTLFNSIAFLQSDGQIGAIVGGAVGAVVAVLVVVWLKKRRK